MELFEKISRVTGLHTGKGNPATSFSGPYMVGGGGGGGICKQERWSFGPSGLRSKSHIHRLRGLRLTFGALLLCLKIYFKKPDKHQSLNSNGAFWEKKCQSFALLVVDDRC